MVVPPVKNILFVTSSMKLGGAEGVSATLIKGWVKASKNVRLVTLGEADGLTHSLPESVQIISLGRSHRWFDFLGTLRRLREEIVSFQPDCVIAFQYKVNVMALLAAIALPIPIVVAEHNNPANEEVTPLWRNLRGIFYKFAHRVVTLTKRNLSYFPEEIGRLGVVIENPLREEFYLPLPAKREKFDERIIAMGRLRRQKGFDLLLRAFARVRNKFPNWSLVIYGEGRERQQLEYLCRELKLNGTVTLPGETLEARKELLDSELFVLSSRWEGFPCVLTEAMACELPVIAFDCPTGPNELIAHDENGHLVPHESIVELGQTMSSLMEDKKERERLGRAAGKVRQRLALDGILSQWEKKVFQGIIPERFHFYWSGQDFGLTNFLAIKSVVKNHPTGKIFIHYEEEPMNNRWWEKICELPSVELKPLSFYELIEGTGFQMSDFEGLLEKGRVNHRSDLLRYLALYLYGGIYLDFDILLLRSLYPLLNKRFFTAFQYYGRGNNFLNGAVLGAVAKDDRLKSLLDETSKMAKEDGPYPWGVFGPSLLTELFLPKGFWPHCSHFLLSLLERMGLANSWVADFLVQRQTRDLPYDIFPRSHFYSITCFSDEWQELFEKGNFVPSAFLVHLWGKQSRERTKNLTIEEIKEKDTKYNQIARRYL